MKIPDATDVPMTYRVREVIDLAAKDGRPWKEFSGQYIRLRDNEYTCPIRAAGIASGIDCACLLTDEIGEALGLTDEETGDLNAAADWPFVDDLGERRGNIRAYMEKALLSHSSTGPSDLVLGY